MERVAQNFVKINTTYFSAARRTVTAAYFISQTQEPLGDSEGIRPHEKRLVPRLGILVVVAKNLLPQGRHLLDHLGLFGSRQLRPLLDDRIRLPPVCTRSCIGSLFANLLRRLDPHTRIARLLHEFLRRRWQWSQQLWGCFLMRRHELLLRGGRRKI